MDDDTGRHHRPGGNLRAFNELFMGMTKHFPPHKLSLPDRLPRRPGHHCLAGPVAHQHQGIAGHLRVWERFAPHFTKVGKTENRVIGVPDSGGHLPLGRHELVLLPAHFMHSEGNFHFYDPVSKILFTGDLGVSMMSGAEASRPVTDLQAHIPRMEGFHRRYMVSNKILRLWEHGPATGHCHDRAAARRPHHGQASHPGFFAWIENLKCGIDLFDDRAYQVPTAHIDPVTRQMRPACGRWVDTLSRAAGGRALLSGNKPHDKRF